MERADVAGQVHEGVGDGGRQPPPPLHLSLRDLVLAGGRQAKRIRVAKRRDVIVAGKHHRFMYGNHDGWLFRYKILHSGRRQIMDFVLPGEIFGLQACLFQGALYSVTTLTEVALTTIPFDVVDDMLPDGSPLSGALLRSAMREAAILGERLTNTGRRSAYERVGHLMLELLVRLSSVGLTRGMSFRMPLTQELIGDALGLTTIHVNRTLRSLRADGLIAVQGRRVTILNAEALSMLSDFDHSYLNAPPWSAGALANA